MSRKIFLALFTFVVSFLLLDKVLYRKPPAACNIYQPDVLFQQSLIPNSKCREKTEEYDVEYKINSLGLRDKEVTYEKPKGVTRILFLGDSFTQGIGVDLDDTIAKVLEDILNKQEPNRFQTINGAVAASTTILQYSFLINKGIKFSPDLVILNLNSTDFLEEIAAEKYSLKVENGQMTFNIKQKTYVPEFLRKYLESNSLTYHVFLANRERLWKLKGRAIAYLAGREPPDYVYSGIDAKPGDSDHDLFAITRDIGDREFEDLFGPATKRISQTNIFLKERNIPLLLVFIPHGHQIAPSQWKEGRMVYKLNADSYPERLNKRLLEFAKSNGINFLDLSQKFKENLLENGDDKIYFNYDGHLTPLGNRLAAEAIDDYISSKLLVSIN